MKRVEEKLAALVNLYFIFKISRLIIFFKNEIMIDFGNKKIFDFNFIVVFFVFLGKLCCL